MFSLLTWLIVPIISRLSLFTILFPFSISDVIAPAELVAPVIVIAPKNTSVVAGASEATLECVANARWVALDSSDSLPGFR